MAAPRSFSPASSELVEALLEVTAAARSTPPFRSRASLATARSARRWECPHPTPSLPEETRCPRNSPELQTPAQSGKAHEPSADAAPRPRGPACETVHPPAAEYPA